MNKESIKFRKPIYVGFSVLELSKLLMYGWYYDKMQPYFGEENLELLYLVTDAFVFSFKLIKNLIEDKKYFKEGLILVIWIHLLNYIQKIIKKLLVKSNWKHYQN